MEHAPPDVGLHVLALLVEREERVDLDVALELLRVAEPRLARDLVVHEQLLHVVDVRFELGVRVVEGLLIAAAQG